MSRPHARQASFEGAAVFEREGAEACEDGDQAPGPSTGLHVGPQAPWLPHSSDLLSAAGAWGRAGYAN